MRMLARRILFYAITALAAVTVDFMIPRVMPGNPVEALLSHMQGPVTLPASEADCPVLHAVPRDGQLSYDEGLLIGYRGYDAAGACPGVCPLGRGDRGLGLAAGSVHGACRQVVA